jgi:hypothetical protein
VDEYLNIMSDVKFCINIIEYKFMNIYRDVKSNQTVCN